MRPAEAAFTAGSAADFFLSPARGRRLLDRRVRRLVRQPQRPQPFHVLVDRRLPCPVLGKALFGLGFLLFGRLFQEIRFASHLINIGTEAKPVQCALRITRDAVKTGRTVFISDRETEREFEENEAAIANVKEAAS
jgi:hypothetical protein